MKLKKQVAFEMPFGSMFSRPYQECNERVIVTSRVIDDVPKSVFTEHSLSSRYCVISFTRIVSGHHKQSIIIQNMLPKTKPTN